MKTKKLKALVLLISFLNFSAAVEFSFKDLTKLASEDLGTNIYLDKDIKDFTVDFNIKDHQKRGEIFEFYKIVLFDNEMILQFNRQGKFYFINRVESPVEPVILPPEPIPYEADELHYYSYKIKNITNNDVEKTMSIFQGIKYVYLSQSDMIAYSSTKKLHNDIKRMLMGSDNKVKSAVVKITLFSTKKDKLLSYGSDIRGFSYNFDSNFQNIYDSLVSDTPRQVNLNSNANFSFTLFALAGHGAVDIFQEPTLRLTNGVKTSANSVNTVAYKESTVAFQENSQTTTDQIKYRDIGLQINVTPKIKDNWVFLDLDLISEELLSLQDNIPLTQKISYKSSVKITRGKPILLTGIKKTSTKYQRDGVPLLQDLPYIGQLFKKQTSQSDNQTINILIEVL